MLFHIRLTLFCVQTPSKPTLLKINFKGTFVVKNNKSRFFVLLLEIN